MQNRKVAIIGGGPGGLTLARILCVHGYAPCVFELDEHALARPQGGSLDLHRESGQLALARAGLLEAFQAKARHEDQELRLYDERGQLLFEELGGADHDRPEIDRRELRDLLLASLADGVVRWGHKVQSIEARADGRHVVSCQNGQGGVFDLVVGADGAWSRVRPLVSKVRPSYTGVTFVELSLDDIDGAHPELARLVGHGKIFALGVGKGIIAQRNGHGQVRVYLAFREPEGWLVRAGVDLSRPDRARSALLAHFEGWAPVLRELIAQSHDRMVERPLHALPIGHCWETRAGFTLLGDAAHLMSPFAGEGVNIAMHDAAELASRLVGTTDWHEALRSYEADMFQRASRAAAQSAEGLERIISADGAQSALQFFRQLMGGDAAAE